MRDASDEEDRRGERFSPSFLGPNDIQGVGRRMDVAGRRINGAGFFLATRDAFSRKREFRCAGYGSELRRGCHGRKILSRRARDGTAMGWRFSGLHWRDLRIFQQKIGTQKTSGGKKGLAILLK